MWRSSLVEIAVYFFRGRIEGNRRSAKNYGIGRYVDQHVADMVERLLVPSQRLQATGINPDLPLMRSLVRRDDADRSRSSTIARPARRCLSPSLATVAYSATMARSRARRCRQADGDHFRLSAHIE